MAEVQNSVMQFQFVIQQNMYMQREIRKLQEYEVPKIEAGVKMRKK
jgi:hypothetical protein